MRQPLLFCHTCMTSFCCALSILLATIALVLFVLYLAMWERVLLEVVGTGIVDTARTGVFSSGAFRNAPDE